METRDKSSRDTVIGALAASAVFLVFLLPLKFGTATGIPALPVTIPSSIYPAIYFQWPQNLFSLLAGFLLLSVEIAAPRSKRVIDGRAMISLAWAVLALSSVLGFVNADALDFPIIQLSHFAGLAAFAMALKRLIDLRPEIKPALVDAVALSTVLVAIMGLDQYLTGFKNTLEFVKQQAELYGLNIPPQLQSRLQETRVFATFSIANSLAGHLLLTIPVTIWAIWTSKRALKAVIVLLAVYTVYACVGSGIPKALIFLIAATASTAATLAVARFPRKRDFLLTATVSIAVGVLLVFVFGATHSRGGFVAVGATLLFVLASFPYKSARWRARSFLTVSVVAGIAAVFARRDIVERGLSSMWVRLDYFKAAFLLLLKHPFAGAGWGGFFQGYQVLKEFPGTESPHSPHNSILNSGSQSGALGFLAATAVLLIPIFLFFLISRKRGGASEAARSSDAPTSSDDDVRGFQLRWVVLAGWCGWAAHSLLDFDIQVPGTVATGIAVLMCVDWSSSVKSPGTEEEAPIRRWLPHLWRATAFMVAIAAIASSYHRLRFDAEYADLLDATNQRLVTARPKPPLSEAKLEFLVKRCAGTAPYSPFPYLAAANATASQHLWVRASNYLEKALEKSPNRSGTHHRLFLTAKQLGKTTDALEHLREAAKLFPNAHQEELERFEKELKQR